MKLGVVYPQTELRGDPEAVRRITLATEELGYDHLLAYDHVLGAAHADRDPALWGPYTERDPFHCPLTMFAYAAAITSRIELVTGVLILPQRQTALVAKQATDVDLLSGERLRLGVGTGWNYVEYDALGEDFATRGPRMSEQIELLRRYWTEDLFSFDGRFDSLDRGNINVRPERARSRSGSAASANRRSAAAGRVGDGFIYAGNTEGVIDGFRQRRSATAPKPAGPTSPSGTISSCCATAASTPISPPSTAGARPAAPTHRSARWAWASTASTATSTTSPSSRAAWAERARPTRGVSTSRLAWPARPVRQTRCVLGSDGQTLAGQFGHRRHRVGVGEQLPVVDIHRRVRCRRRPSTTPRARCRWDR